MPNLRSQLLSDGVLEIVASDGRTFTLTKDQAMTFYRAQSGNAASKKSKTITWVKNQIIAALGAEQFDALLIDFDLDPAAERFVRAEFRQSGT